LESTISLISPEKNGLKFTLTNKIQLMELLMKKKKISKLTKHHLTGLLMELLPLLKTKEDVDLVGHLPPLVLLKVIGI
jgi:hypothetical protein